MSAAAPNNTNGPRLVRADCMPADTPQVPVVMVGAGACGLTAAVRLRDAGIDCVLLERDAMATGSTALSSGFIPAAGTRLQKSLGIEDSAQLFAKDIQAKAHGDAAPHLVTAFAQAVAQAIDSLEQHGIGFEVLDGFLYPGHSVRRMHALPALLDFAGRYPQVMPQVSFTDRFVDPVEVDHDGDFDLRGADEFDVDARIGQ